METPSIRSDDARHLMRLIGDVRAAATPAQAGRHLVDGLCRLVDADAGWFVDLIQRDGRWTTAGAGAGSVVDARVTQYMAQYGREFPVEFDVMGAQIIADDRPAFVQHWRDAAAAAPAARLAPFADLVGTLGIADMADPVFSLVPGHRFAINLQRVGSARRPFTDRESSLLALVATELRWLHETGRLQLSERIPGQVRLSHLGSGRRHRRPAARSRPSAQAASSPVSGGSQGRA
jgi:hypothetical protein